MTVEQRQVRLDEVLRQLCELKNEENELYKEKRLASQQEDLEFVGRAFIKDGAAYLITSVPPIICHLHGDVFSEHCFPCIKIPSEKSEPPIFDSIVFLTKEKIVYERIEEISFSKFQKLLNERIEYLLKRASTAKLRQNGKEVYQFSDRIREKDPS